MDKKLDVQLTFRTTKDLEDRIKAEANKKFLPMSRTITIILDEYFRRQDITEGDKK